MNYKIKFLNEYNEVSNQEIMDVFFSAKTNSLHFLSEKEAYKMRMKLIMIKAEKKGKTFDDLGLPELETEFAKTNQIDLDPEVVKIRSWPL